MLLLWTMGQLSDEPEPVSKLYCANGKTGGVYIDCMLPVMC
jgi:hypothetical protein